VAASDLVSLKRTLEDHGLAVLGPVELPWMSARSLYFSDPDGHDLEFCATEMSPEVTA
jgi:lactoylglutathione lyase